MILKLTKSQLKTLLRSSKHFILVDTTPSERFTREHIPGAFSLPLNEIDNQAEKLLSQEDLIIVYDENIRSNISERAAHKLTSLGFKHVLEFPGGMEDYKDTHLPLAGELHASFSAAARY